MFLGVLQIVHFVSLALVQGLTNGVIQLLMGSTLRFHSPIISRISSADSSTYLHSALQIGGVAACIIAIVSPPQPPRTFRVVLAVGLVVRSVILICPVIFDDLPVSMLLAGSLGVINAAVEIGVYFNLAVLPPAVFHIVVFLFTSLESFGQLTAATAEFLRIILGDSSSPKSLFLSASLLSMLLGILSLFIFLSPPDCATRSKITPGSLITAACGSLLSSALVSTAARAIPFVARTQEKDSEVSLVGVFFITFTASRILSTCFLIKRGFTKILWLVFSAAASLAALSLLSGSPCGVSLNAAALGFSLGPLYPSALCSIGAPGSLIQIGSVVLSAQLGKLASRIRTGEHNFTLLMLAVINLATASVAHLMRQPLEQETEGVIQEA